ncbi:MAG: GNAT family N-acetyltransferase [Vulcanimicrobiaceae bacterium]
MEIRELAAGDTALAFEPMAELRAGHPVVESLETFVRWVNERQRPEGYRLVATFVPPLPAAIGVAGFRRLHTLAWGDVLYIDDLGTLETFRGHGHANALLRWIAAEGERLGCEQLHLDSGHHRHAAHRVYLAHRFRISSHHFSRVLDASTRNP